jgi:peptide deformylase
MILPIVQYGHPVLRERCKPVGEIDDSIRQLAADMIETMYDAEGVGLAAPQVAVNLRLAVIDVSHDPECISYLRVNGQDAELGSIMPIVIINPEIELLGPKERDREGCLSIDGVRAEVTRPTEIKCELTTLTGERITLETDGLLARAFQHEIDHLNGVLFIDRLSPAAKVSVRRQLKRIAQG